MQKKYNTRPWQPKRPPKRILVMRFQAVGDVMIIYPYIQALKNKYPNTQIDLLTMHEKVELATHLGIFRKVWSITDSRRAYPQLIHALWMIPRLLIQRYEVVLDLQNHKISNWIRKLLFPKAFAEFDTLGDKMASIRYFQTIERCGLLDKYEQASLKIPYSEIADKILIDNGWDGQSKIVILNPAGAFPSRHWQKENYVSFAKIWQEKHTNTQFLILGTEKISAKSVFFKENLGEKLIIDLVGKTTLFEAILITSKAQLIISEDSGLLHAGWILKIHSVALIGSTHKNRSAQSGENTYILNSDDLPCGNCMKADCQFGEIPPCLSRYSPEKIVEIAEKLLTKK